MDVMARDICYLHAHVHVRVNMQVHMLACERARLPTSTRSDAVGGRLNKRHGDALRWRRSLGGPLPQGRRWLGRALGMP